jgi:hypothetical protein
MEDYLKDDRMLIARQSALAMGYKVRSFNAGMEVRLPLFCSVRIETDGDGMRFAPRFGSMGRTGAIWSDTFAAFVFLLFALLLPEFIHGLKVILVGCAVLTAVWDVFRMILTESFITRLYVVMDRDTTRS